MALISITTDITSHKGAEAYLLRTALHDPLTGLPNRVLFFDRVGQAVERASQRPQELCAVLLLDLDHFKSINDRFGHSAGDRVLVEVARRLEGCLRSTDTVSRYSGDAFALLLEDLAGPGDATRVAERIQQALAVPFSVDGETVAPTASIGIALSSSGTERPAELLRNADSAMYYAKALGKARHAVYDVGV